MDLSLRRATVSGVDVLSATGEIDLATLPRFRDALTRLVDEHPGGQIAVDLDGVLVLDDTGLGVLLGAAGRAREQGGELIVVCTDPRLRQRFELNGLARAVCIVNTVHDLASG